MTEYPYASMRAAMVESQLRTSDVNDTRVIAAMAHVPREAYLPAELRALAYIDRPVRLGNGRAFNPPLATGRLLTEAAVKAGEKVLLIGAATGYTAALLTAMGAQVTAVEEDAALGEGAAIVRAPLCAGAPDKAPYDLILIDGAVEQVPQALIDQLADGGRVSTGLVERGVTRLATGRKSGGAFALITVADLEMAVLPGFAIPRSFVF